MADNPTGLTTEQLLLELGKVVLGLGRKIDSLGEKLDGIHAVISQDLIPALSKTVPPDCNNATVMDITPLNEKLDELKGALERQSSDKATGDAPQQSEALSEKLTAILDVLSTQILPAMSEKKNEEAAGQLDITPLVEKLDELKGALERQSSDKATGDAPQQSEALSEKLAAILDVLSGQLLPELREIKTGNVTEQLDLTPVILKLDALTTAIAGSGESGDLKPLLEAMTSSLEQLPSLLANRLKEIGSADSSNPMQTVEEKLAEICEKLEEIRITSGNREFVASLSERISEVKERLVSSGDDMLTAVREIPGKVDKMGENLSGAINLLTENTAQVLSKADLSLSESKGTLLEIKNELNSGLKLNTEMTCRMVELTSRFTDRAMEDRVLDLNTRAINHFNCGEFSEAGILFSQAIDISPENPELLCNIAHLKAAIGDMEASEKFFKLALQASPNLEPAVSGLGMLMVKTGRAEETIEFLKQTVLSGEASVRTVIAYSRALAALTKHDEAVELLEASLRAAPDNPDLNEELSLYGHGETTE
jgi:tetratricopeptide (TPR) repeat protein